MPFFATLCGAHVTMADTGNAAKRSEGKPQKKRRRAVAMSRVDEELIREGIAPSWKAVRPPQPEKAKANQQDGNETARDRELRENVPPHW